MPPSLRPKQNNRLRPYTTSRPSFFPHSQNFAIYGGVFIAGDHQGAWHELSAPEHSANSGLGGSREAEANSYNDIPKQKKISRNFVRSQHNLKRRDEWIFSIGEQKDETVGQSKVIIQTFVGRRARQLWQSTIDYAQRLVNPNLLNIVGTSSEDDRAHYILFDAAQLNDTCSLIAAGLRLGEMETTVFGMRIVYGIASGLDFLAKISPSLSPINVGIESFDVFSDDFGDTVLTFIPHGEQEQTKQRGKRNDPVQLSWLKGNVMHYNVNKDDIALFDSLVTKLFNDANCVIYRDRLDHNDDDDLEVESSNGSQKQCKTDSPQDSRAYPPEVKSIACR
ncbi:hypothetical protein GYMLUDRAFT_244048 [Collybiopsis luxurians FD-317 M1]|uniref:Uncharacterized protein n=1 Tax=Collybiopsis luxurians FD-317 M1 TaxID=944289 RepID=A0A0D0BAY3_9AGAR|nr:hypothetical protein GYMLUDRAFT_244048 [Collybiopsis luxurians FD-317 M1]